MGDTRSQAVILSTDVVGFRAVMARSRPEALALRERHRKTVGELTGRFRGRFFEATDVASLSTFSSAADAVSCAVALQEELESEPNLALRICVHQGEVIEEDDHLVGRAVDVAGRILPLAGPGDICITSRVWEEVEDIAGFKAVFLGDQPLENEPQPVGVWRMEPPAEEPESEARGGPTWLRTALFALGGLFLLVAAFAAVTPLREALVLALIRSDTVHLLPTYDQEVRFTTSADGVRLAWASVGEGTPVVQVSGWATHLEYGLGSPGNNAVVPLLMDDHRVIVYDGRGFGLSDRGVEDFSLEARVADLEAVMDAAGIERAPLVAFSSAALPAVAFAARHPERVERLLLYGAGPVFGASSNDLAVREQARSLAALARGGWSDDDPAFREVFASLFMPDASPLLVRAFDELQRASTDADDLASFLEATLEIDVTDLASRVQAPTLVIHVRDDRIVPYDQARRLAALIPDATLVTLEGRNHLPLPGTDAADELQQRIAGFASEGDAAR